MPTVKIRMLMCPKCGHKWVPRVHRVTRCPSCFKRLGGN